MAASGQSDRSSALLEEIEQLVGLGTWSWTPGARDVACSAVAHRLLGVAPDTRVTFATLRAAISASDHPLVDEVIRRALTQTIPVEVEVEVVDREGQSRILDLRGRPVQDAGGNVVEVRGTVQDVTVLREAARSAAESHRRLQALLEHVPAAITLRGLDGRYLAFGRGAAKPGTRSAEERVDTGGWASHSSPEVIERVAAEEAAVLATGTARSFELDLGPAGVDAGTLLVTTFPVRDSDGEITAIGGMSLDVTDRRRAEESLRRTASQFRAAFDEAPIGMALFSPDGRLRRANAALSELTGRPPEALTALEPYELIAALDRRGVAREFEALEPGSSRASIEHRIVRADGQIRWVNTRATLIGDETGAGVQLLAQIQDVTERRANDARLRRMALRDPLTGLLNRRGLETALTGHLERCRRYGFCGALLILDLDGFKVVNDTLGHAYGDRLIARVADALRERLRATDTIARLGGDEFAILLPIEDESAARQAAEALVATVAAKANPTRDGHPGRITASVGVAIFDDPALDADTMLVNADLAMYEAKQDGKARVVVYSRLTEQVPRVKAELEWLGRIENALDTDDFTLFAQPMFDLRTGKVLRHEVLVRMLSPTGELIAPGRFLEVAERFGMMPRLDRWILGRALKVMATAQASGQPLPLAVNLSGAAIGDPEIVTLIEAELAAGHLLPDHLTIEVAERVALADLARMRTFTEALITIGCRVTLDDFGAGMAAFRQLKDLPFDLVKIDGEFMRASAGTRADRLVVRAICELAQELGKDVGAESVADGPLLDTLLGLGVNVAQGYHLGRPRPLCEVLGGGLASDLAAV